MHVEADPIFVRDDKVYTSAGISAGIDLALALVEEDLRREDLASDCARSGRVPAASGGPATTQCNSFDNAPPIAIHSKNCSALAARSSGSRFRRRETLAAFANAQA